MNGFLLRILITSAGLWLAASLSGIHIVGLGTLISAALLLGVANAVIRPVLIVLTLPITILTMGIFLLFINAIMLGLVAAMLRGFSIDGFGWAILGSVIITITSWIGNAFIGPKGRVEIYTHRDRR